MQPFGFGYDGFTKPDRADRQPARGPLELADWSVRRCAAAATDRHAHGHHADDGGPDAVRDSDPVPLEAAYSSGTNPVVCAADPNTTPANVQPYLIDAACTNLIGQLEPDQAAQLIREVNSGQTILTPMLVNQRQSLFGKASRTRTKAFGSRFTACSLRLWPGHRENRVACELCPEFHGCRLFVVFWPNRETRGMRYRCRQPDLHATMARRGWRAQSPMKRSDRPSPTSATNPSGQLT